MPGIDAHVHVGESIQGFGQDVPAVLAEMDRLGLERALLVPVRPPNYQYEEENDRVAASCREHADRFWGLGRVDARLSTGAAEARRCLDELGLRGIYLHPFEDAVRVSDPRLEPVLEVCAERGAALVVASGYPWVSEATQVADLAGRFPSVPLVMTNGGQINISGLGQRNAWLALAEHPSVHIATSGVYRQDFIEEVIAGIGPERVVFASQSPLFDQDYELHRILWAHVDEGVKEIVLEGNARRLFGWEP